MPLDEIRDRLRGRDTPEAAGPAVGDRLAKGSDEDGWPGPRMAGLLLALILLLAFALRILYILQVRSAPWFDNPTMDALYHTEWARAIASGKTFQEGPFFRAPLYPWFLGASFRLFGENLLLPRLIQALFGTGAAALCYLIGRDAFDRKTGLLAALFLSASWILVYFDGELLIPSLAVPLNLLALWLSLRLSARCTAGGAVMAGVAWGTAAIARPNVLLFMPFLALWLILLHRGSRGRGMAMAASLAAGVLLPVLPVSAYNYFAGGDAVLVSSQGGVNFWIGNNPRSDGTTAIVPGTRDDWWGGYHDAIAQAEREEGRPLKPSEVSRHYAGKAWRFILGDPAAAARHFAWKARLFWTDWELGNNKPVRFIVRHYAPFILWLPFGFALLAPLGVLGLLLGFRGGMRRFPLWGFFLAYSASVVLFFVCSRFRVPVMPLLAIYGAHGTVALVSFLRRGRYAQLAASLLLLFTVFLFARHVPPSVDRSDALGLHFLALQESRVGRLEEAAALLRRSLDERPDFAYSHRELGHLLSRMGRYEEAERHLREALRLKGDDGASLEALLELYLRRGRLDEAASLAARAVEEHPAGSVGHYYLGRVLLEKGKTEEGERSLARALKLDPGCVPCAVYLGEGAFQRGDWGEAERYFRRAVEVTSSRGADAGFWIYMRLLQSLRGEGRSAEAERLADALRKRYASDPSAREILESLGPE